MHKETITVNNQVTAIGEITSAPVFSHTVLGENFYQIKVSCDRLSGYHDVIPVTVSDRLVDMKEPAEGRTVCVSGRFQSYNRHDPDKNRLVLSVFAKEIGFMEGTGPDPMTNNQIFLGGYLCRVPVYRVTPLGREVADLLLAVNRAYNKSDYIPCIVWGRNARFVGTLRVGDHVSVRGRIQSRGYTKKREDGSTEERMAYEVSVNSIELADEPGKMEAEG